MSAIEVMLAIRDGRFAEAEQLAWYGAQLCAIRWYQGRTAELFPLLDHLVHSPTLSTVDNSFRATLAAAAALSGDRRKAQCALAQDQLDREALRQYRSRLAELRGRDLSDAERAEHDRLTGEVAAATGLGGRVRTFTDSGERAGSPSARRSGGR